MSIKVINFGCRLNSYESEVIKQSATEAGLENAIIFNSCAVTEEAERGLRQSIRRARKENPDARLIVAGCAAQLNPQKYSEMEGVDSVLGNVEKTKVESYSALKSERAIMVQDIMQIKETASAFVDAFDSRSRAFLEIQNGCNHRCTFCIIPFARGNNRSVGAEQIISQIRALVKDGFNEVVLTGVDISDYGKDISDTASLGHLVRAILDEVPELQRLRLSSIDVAEIDATLLDIIITEKRFMPHIHISVQAGDDMILKRMKRRHNRKQVIDFTRYVKAHRPEVVFGADIIAGFPTETDEMFENTYNLVREAGLTYLHVFPYSERSGTPAARMPQVEKHVRKERAKKLRELGEQMLVSHLTSLIGHELEVIVEQNGWGRASDFTQVKLQGDHPVGAVIKVKAIALCDGAILSYL